MRVESITAHSFGPLAGETLQLASGMTVVSGLNESAKSSWHAAIYAALCGRRRGKGAPTRDERRFAELHKPWDDPEWRVSAVIVLDDDRRIEVNQDLDGKVDCRATDLAMGRDVSCEIMWEGCPDASRYLGLDRKSFAATAIVNQAELLTILTAADGLQEQLQRAAATAGTDATAAAALECLEKFFRDNVGLNRSNSTKPLRAAKARLERAEAALAAAVTNHAEYLRLVADADDQREEANQAGAMARSAETAVEALRELLGAARAAATAHQQAAHAQETATERGGELTRQQRRLDRATELHTHFGGVAPSGLSETDDTARIVAAGLAGWESAPTLRPLSGHTAEQLRSQLAALPQLPTGDLSVDPGVRAMISAHEQSLAVSATHEQRRPPGEGTTTDPTLAAAVEAGPAQLRELAASLAAVDTQPTGPDELDSNNPITIRVALDAARTQQTEAARLADNAQQAADDAAHSYRRISTLPTNVSHEHQPAVGNSGKKTALLAAGCALALLGVLLMVFLNQPMPGGAVLILALLVAGASLTAKKPAVPTPIPQSPQPPTAPLDHAATEAQQTALGAEHAHRRSLTADRLVAEYEGRLEAATASARRTQNARSSVAAQCAARGVPADAGRLRDLAAHAERLTEQRNETSRWTAERKQHQRDIEHTEERLRAGLADHGVPADLSTSVADLVAAYEHTCTQRNTQAASASRRSALEQALNDRQSTEDAAEEARSTREQARRQLAAAATTAAVPLPPNATPDLIVAALTAWQAQWSEQMHDAEDEQKDWSELLTLLDGISILQLQGDVEALRATHGQLVTAADELGAKALQATHHCAEIATVAGSGPDVAGDIEAIEKLLLSAKEDVAVARRASTALTGTAEHADGALHQLASSLLSVPEAEEQLDAAEAEYVRVSELANTLALTQEFLTAAQDRVHRDIAPLLAATLRDWLPSVTSGRYVDASVDPATLHVKVRGATSRNWRDADRLSIGTAEQVYLLLRVALAQHLAVTGETCPLLLDDVTVQADVERTREILDLLLRLSEHRQIVLFAQEPSVTEWAQSHLIGTERHALRELPPLATD